MVNKKLNHSKVLELFMSYIENRVYKAKKITKNSCLPFYDLKQNTKTFKASNRVSEAISERLFVKESDLVTA